MSKLVARTFTFVEREFEKYPDFKKRDELLDTHTTAFLSKDLVVSLRRAYRLTDTVSLAYAKYEYTEGNGSMYFYRGLLSHVALTYWQPAVGSLELGVKEWNSVGALSLTEMGHIYPMQHRSTALMNMWMSRYTRGIFDLPVRDIAIFPLVFALEYSLSKWILKETDDFFGAYREDLQYRIDANERMLQQELIRIRGVVQSGN